MAEDLAKNESKRLKNYPDPMEVVGKYGANALRFYLLSSPAVRGENLNFSEKGVDEIYKKVIMRLWNVYKFYELYSEKKIKVERLAEIKSVNVLDIWILARLDQLIAEVSEAMDKYELDNATRPIADFVDDLSTWYIRRSRSRFSERGKTFAGRGNTQKELELDKNSAIATTNFVLSEFSKVIAPFMPFTASDL